MTLEASVSPSEDPEKVAKAMGEVLGGPPDRTKKTQMSIMMESGAEGLSKIHDQFRDRHVRATARRLALGSLQSGRFTLMLNRQAAYCGVIALCSSEEESTLGPIFLTVRSDAIDSVLGYLTDYVSR